MPEGGQLNTLCTLSKGSCEWLHRLIQYSQVIYPQCQQVKEQGSPPYLPQD